MTPVSSLHSIRLGEAHASLLTRPQTNDFSLHLIDRKVDPSGRQQVQSELVIAGSKTREKYPIADEYPIHFLKSYFPWTLHQDPKIEYENNLAASNILHSPPPIGYDHRTIRLSFIPGKSLTRFSPFTNIEPPERCLSIARETPQASLIGLWLLAEQTYELVKKLHQHRFFHGDLELHNIVICLSPVAPFLIDFESSQIEFQGTEAEWAEAQFKDLRELLRLAIYLQASLGRQKSALAQASLEKLPRLFKSASTFAARLDLVDENIFK